MIDNRTDEERLRHRLTNQHDIYERIAVAIDAVVQRCWLEERARACADPKKPLRSEVSQSGPSVTVHMCSGTAKTMPVGELANLVSGLVGVVHDQARSREISVNAVDALHVLAHSPTRWWRSSVTRRAARAVSATAPDPVSGSPARRCGGVGSSSRRTGSWSWWERGARMFLHDPDRVLESRDSVQAFFGTLVLAPNLSIFFGDLRGLIVVEVETLGWTVHLNYAKVSVHRAHESPFLYDVSFRLPFGVTRREAVEAARLGFVEFVAHEVEEGLEVEGVRALDPHQGMRGAVLT